MVNFPKKKHYAIFSHPNKKILGLLFNTMKVTELTAKICTIKPS